MLCNDVIRIHHTCGSRKLKVNIKMHNFLSEDFSSKCIYRQSILNQLKHLTIEGVA